MKSLDKIKKNSGKQLNTFAMLGEFYDKPESSNVFIDTSIFYDETIWSRKEKSVNPFKIKYLNKLL